MLVAARSECATTGNVPRPSNWPRAEAAEPCGPNERLWKFRKIRSGESAPQALPLSGAKHLPPPNLPHHARDPRHGDISPQDLPIG